MLRLIAVQFIDVNPDEDAKDFVCRKRDLLLRLTELSALHAKPFVLVIDELNGMGVPINGQAADFLKQHFLDEAGRYLIFSSHIMVSLATLSHVASTRDWPSDRYIRMLHLPFCLDKRAIREMGDAYGSLTY